MYETLKKIISEIKIIDNHSHPGCFKATDELEMPQDARFPFDDKFSHPSAQAYGFDYLEELHYEAYEKFYGFSREDINNPEKYEELSQIYESKKANMDDLLSDIMKAAKVEYVMANLAMPKQLYGKENIGILNTVDPLLFPFNNEHMFEKPFGKIYLKQFEHYLKLYKQKYEFNKDEFTYNEYMNFVNRVLESLKEEGCLGYKFICAYVRNTYFEKYDENRAEDFFNRAKQGDHKAYTAFQDCMAWYIFRKAASLDMPIQIHMAMIDGDAEYTNPLNLLKFTMDNVTCNTKIVVLHCAYPRFNEMTTLALAAKLFHQNHIYIDISGRVMFGNHPKVIAKNIRNWLDYPALWSKIIYGSDALFGERVIYTASKTARDAVYYALESALNDGLFSEKTAIEIAKKILRNNAIDLYNLPLEKM